MRVLLQTLLQTLSCFVLLISTVPALASDVSFFNAEAIDYFYAHRSGRPYWTDRSGLSRAGGLMFKTIERAWTHGLNPESYHQDAITKLIGVSDHESRNHLEYLLSDAYARYVRDMTGMRVDAKGLLTDAASWSASVHPQEAFDLLREKSGLRRILNSLEPSSRTYNVLKTELQTLSQDPVLNKEKIEKIIVNLERLRWAPRDKPEKHIVVNVPSAMLWAVDGSRDVIEMPVVVGRRTRPTHSFISKITGVRINPSWTVPKTIKREDILPKAQESADYFHNKGMEVIKIDEVGRQTLDPTMVDWNSFTPDEMSGVRFVQTPGLNVQ